jgi:predicted Zn-dependent protease with MMP-like domain
LGGSLYRSAVGALGRAFRAEHRRARPEARAPQAPTPTASGLEAPVALSTFEHLVEGALAELPADIRAQMSNVAVVVEDEPPPGERRLGFYRGIPLTRRSHAYAGALPDTITIYRGPLERIYGSDPEQLYREVRHTVWHEVAHHFGISDARLVEIGRY